jgi:putative mRNA 3-end processing factor
MEISFQHANPDSGNESFLLRFDGAVDGPAPCVLVDAGDGTDVDALLGPEDRLAAICLTHAHLDHYASLPSVHRRGVPVFASQPTVAALGDVFDVASDEYDVDAGERLEQAITPVSAWRSVVPGVELRPVPAGHIPGAASFLFRLSDDGDHRHVLVTGDFTRRDAGGFPGLEPDSLPDIDVLFLNASTDDVFESDLTEGLGSALVAANGGARTLLTTSGLFGVQCADLLAELSAEYDLGVRVRAVGQVAKLYDVLGGGRVETVPEFERPDHCLDPGVVTVAGPETPQERSSGRLFGQIEDDPGACLVQLVGSGYSPVETAGCTVHSFRCSNHPTRETLTAVHDALDPVQTVVVHSHGGAGDRFNDLDSVVWGSGDTDEYTLYDGSRWRLPPWMGGGTPVMSNTQFGDIADTTGVTSAPLPDVERRSRIDPAAEGVDRERIEGLLHHSPTADGDDSVTPQPARTDGEGSDSDRSASTPDTPVSTVDADIGDRIDPAAEAMLEEKGISKAEFGRMLKQKREREAAERSADPATPTDGATKPNAADGSEEPVAADDADTAETFSVELEPIAAVLAGRAAGDRSRDAYVAEAVETYVLALLSGEATGSDDERFSLELDIAPAGESLLADAAADAGFDSLPAAAVRGIVTALDVDDDSVELPVEYRAQLDAAVRNDDFAFTDRAAVVGAAVAYVLAE